MIKQGMNPYKGRQIPKGAVQAAISKTLSMRAAAKEMNVAYIRSRSTLNCMIYGKLTKREWVLRRAGPCKVCKQPVC